MAHADLVAKTADNELRLLNSPCTHGGTLALLKPEHRPKFKKAIVMLKTLMVYGCWVDTGEGAYFVMLETGGGFALPVTAFLEEPGT